MGRGAFDRPALGLVLLLLGALGLGEPAGQLAQLIPMGGDSALEITAATMLGLAIVTMIAGWLIATRPRAATAAFVTYGVAAAALFAVAVVELLGHDAIDRPMIAGVALDTIGIPVVLAIAACGIATGREQRASLADAGAVLVVSALAGIANSLLVFATQLRYLQRGQLSALWAGGTHVGQLATSAIALAAAVAALGGAQAQARRRLAVWVIAAIATRVVLGAVQLYDVWGLVTSLTARAALGVALAPIVALVIWGYARTATDAPPRPARAATATLGWVALVWVAPLIGKIVELATAPAGTFALSRHHGAFEIGLLCATQAALQVLAGTAALRASSNTFRYAVAAALLATVLFVIAVVIASADIPSMHLGMIPMFWASTVALAWVTRPITPAAAATPGSAA